MDERLARMNERHRAIARYTVYFIKDGPRRVIATGLHLEEARAVHDEEQAKLEASKPHYSAWADGIVSFELENYEETLTPQARERLIAIGKLDARGSRKRRTSAVGG